VIRLKTGESDIFYVCAHCGAEYLKEDLTCPVCGKTFPEESYEQE